MDYKEMTTKELKAEYRSYYQDIYEVGCYGTSDLRILDAIANELEQRGVEISMTPEFN